MALSNADHRTCLVSPFPTRHGAFHVLDGFDEWHDTGRGGFERAHEVAPDAERWLDDHAAEDDWYLHVNFWDPHGPYDTPLEYGNPFADEHAPEWLDEETIAAQYESYGPHSAHDVRRWTDPGGGHPDWFDDAAIERMPEEIDSREAFGEWIDGYDVGIHYMDDHIDRLLDRLREAGVREDTLIVLSADHGENLGEQNVYGDHMLADHWTTCVPLIVSGPGVAPGVDDGLRYDLDVPPTLLELAGGDVPAGWDGESFAGALADGSVVTDAGREFLVTGQGAWTCQRGIRWDDWLLLETYHDGWQAFDRVELYDLTDDPHETTYLAADHEDAVEHGLSLLERWYADRQLDAATGRNGGNPDAPSGLVDPLFKEIRDGGPTYLRGEREAYLETLRETDREAAAERIERFDGTVPSETNR